MSSEPTNPTALSPGDAIGKYRLVRVVGTGGMGAVFEATGPGGRVAIKALSKAGGWADAQQRARFLREAAVCEKLNNPNIVRVLDHGIDPKTDTPFLVMPFLEGEDLASIITRLGAIEPDVAVRLFIQAARGLQAAHAAGVVHRDVKPSNLYVERSSGGALTLKVCDFGLAKATFEPADSLTSSGTFLGTPHYVSPEQATNAKRVDQRSDVWSLAMSLYHALAGQPAFAHVDNVAALVFELTAGNVKPLQDAAPWVEPRLARAVHGCLILEQDARCPSMFEFARALSSILGEDDLTTLTSDRLASASEETKSRSAPRADLPTAWKEVAEEDPDDSQEMVGTTIGGRYKLVRIIGRGGMGTVFETSTPEGTRYALKMIRPEIARRSRDAMRRFLREAKTAQTIDSEHVTKVVDAGSDERGSPYIVMELLSGADLGKLMREQGPLEETPIVPVFVQACRGLAAAHALGIVHRDIKPANIFLHQRADGVVVTKLCDFGVAKHTTATELEDATTDLTRTGGMLGSPIYMSPEQAQNAKNVDHRTDLWSLAVTMHQALSGRRPWQGCSTMGELILAICTKKMTPLTEVAPWIDPKLADVVHKALERDVAARFASAEEMAAALEPFGDRGPTLHMSALVPVSGDRRASSDVAPRPVSATALADSISTDAQVSTARVTRGRSRRSVAVVGGVLGSAALAAFLFLRRGTDVAPITAVHPPDPIVVAPRKLEPAAPVVVVRVPVKPPNAKVSIAGTPRDLVDGALVLEGKPGESFVVVVELDGRRSEVPVAITSDGKAIPHQVELTADKPAASVEPAKAGGDPAKAPRPIVAATHPSADPAAAKPSAAPAPSPAPVGSSLPELKKSW